MAEGPKRPQKPSNPPRDENLFEDDDLDDEIDAFHKQRDVVPLDVEDDDDTDDDEEYPVLGIEDSADDDSDEEKNDEDDDIYDDKDIAKMKRQAKYMEQIVGGKDDLSDDAEPEKESQAVWGNKRSIYYERGGKEHESSDEEKSKVEEAEAVRLQKERCFLRMGDLDLPSDSDLDQDEGDSVQEKTSQLGETICPMKEDFIMVHLQHACNHCCILMVSGTRWVCNHCKNFQLCDKCNDAERKLDERERHPVNSREKHLFRPVEITDVCLDTKDNDDILESEFFDTRQAFLSLCQGNHYQYDTLRRAKHSSMMVLYHLHNPTAPAFVTTCNTCHHDIETGQGWRCEICPDFDVCSACYQKDGGVDHPHKLTNHPSIAERDAQNQEAREKRVLQLRKMLDLLVHASQCRFSHCQYPNCRKVKGLFRHGIQCKTRASGGCPLCKKMWYLLQLHARACKVSGCHVPRCKDLKEHLKRLQQQSDSRRRAAVMEMMRQRAAEVAGGNE